MTLVKHGTRAGYIGGCRCAECKGWNAAKARRRRQRLRGLDPREGDWVPSQPSQAVRPPTVPSAPMIVVAPPARPPAPPVEATAPGDVERATVAELGTLTAAETRPGLAASLVRMSQIIDNARLSTTAPAAQRRLADGLDKLHRASVGGNRGQLALVADMSRRSAKGPQNPA